MSFSSMFSSKKENEEGYISSLIAMPPEVQDKLFQTMPLRSLILLYSTSREMRNCINQNEYFMRRLGVTGFDELLDRVRKLENKERIREVLDDEMNLATAEMLALPSDKRIEKVIDKAGVDYLEKHLPAGLSASELLLEMQKSDGLQMLLFEGLLSVKQLTDFILVENKVLPLLIRPVIARALHANVITLEELQARDPVGILSPWKDVWLGQEEEKGLTALRKRHQYLFRLVDGRGRFDALPPVLQLAVVDEDVSLETAEKLNAALNPKKGQFYTNYDREELSPVIALLEGRGKSLNEEELRMLNQEYTTYGFLSVRFSMEERMNQLLPGSARIQFSDRDFLSVAILEGILPVEEFELMCNLELVHFLGRREGLAALREGLVTLNDFKTRESFFRKNEIDAFLGNNCALLRNFKKMLADKEGESADQLRSQFRKFPTIYRMEILRGNLTIEQAEAGFQLIENVTHGYMREITAEVMKENEDKLYLLAVKAPEQVKEAFEKMANDSPLGGALAGLRGVMDFDSDEDVKGKLKW